MRALPSRLGALALGVAALGLGVSACGLSPYAAKVNGQVITRSDLFTEMDAISANTAYVSSLRQQGVSVRGKAGGTFTTTFADQILGRQISFALVHQEDARRGIKITANDLSLARADLVATFGSAKLFDAFPKSYQAYLVKSSAELTALESAIAKIPVDEAALRSYYASHQAQLSSVCLSVIVVATSAQATKVEAALHKGVSFATLAKSQSVDPSTAPNGGVAGCTLASGFAQTYGAGVAQEAQSLAAGQVGAAVHVSTSSGQSAWIVPEVTSRKPLGFTQSTPVIRGLLLNGSVSKLAAALVKLSKSGHIVVDPSYGRFVIKGGTPQVVAPTSPPAADLVLPTGTTTTTTAPAAGLPGATAGG